MTSTSEHIITEGDIVSAGKPGTDDFDVGVVRSVDRADNDVQVAWDSGAVTDIDVDDLTVVAESGDSSHKRGEAQRGAWARHREIRRSRELIDEVASIIGHHRVPGADLHVIVENALANNPKATAHEVVDIIEEAEEEHAANVAHDARDAL